MGAVFSIILIANVMRMSLTCHEEIGYVGLQLVRPSYHVKMVWHVADMLCVLCLWNLGTTRQTDK